MLKRINGRRKSLKPPPRPVVLPVASSWGASPEEARLAMAALMPCDLSPNVEISVSWPGLDEEAHGGAPGLPRLWGYWGSVTPFFGDEAIPSYGCLQTDGVCVLLGAFYWAFYWGRADLSC